MRKFLLNLMLVSLPIGLVIGGLTAYYSWYVSPNLTRDLSVLAVLPFPTDYNVPAPDKDRVANCEFVPIDSLTAAHANNALWVLGDSFTQLCISNAYLDYFLCDSTDRYVIIEDKSDVFDPIQMFVTLINSDVAMPSVVLIETVQRLLVERLNAVDFTPQCENKNISTNAVTSSRSQHYSPLFTLRHACKYLILRMGLYEDALKKGKLNRPMFTCAKHENDLFFYMQDLQTPDDCQIRTAAQNLAHIFDIAQEKGIDLYFFIAADKYEIYRKLITQNIYNESEFLDRFMEFADNNPRIINSADTLRKMAANGVLDIYYCDDSHWSPIGAKAAGRYLTDRVRANKQSLGK